MATHDPYGTACVMLGLKYGEEGRLHHDLFDLLTSVDDMCEMCGGELVSRQIIALAICFWRRAHPGQEPVGD